MAKSRRIFREHQHPRDDRGRFAKKGGGRWVGRVVRQSEASFVDTSSARPGMRSGTVGGGLLDLGAIGKANAGFNRPTAQKRATPSAPGVAEFMAKPAPKPAAKAPRRGSFELGPQSRASSESKRVPAFMAKADADMARKRGEARPKGEGGASPAGALGKLTDQQIANGIEMLGTDSPKGRALAAERARRLLDTSRDTRKIGEVTITTPEPQKSTAFDQLFDPNGPSNATVKNKHARNILAQMEAHDWKLVAQDPMLQFTTWKAPDGREMSVQFLTGDKPKFMQGGRYNSRDLSLKAALVYAVTPILEEKGGASIAGAMERLGMPSLAEKSWSDPGPGVRDASLRPLANAQRDMMSAYGPAKKTTAEAVADLRTAAARNREVADQRDAFNRKSGLGNIDGQAAFMRQRADEFEKVAAELEKMDAERAEFEAERDRRAGLPLDIRPTTRLTPARKATPKQADALAAGREAGEQMRVAVLKTSTDPKDNGAKVKALEDGSLDAVDLYRTAMAGPSGQRAAILAGRVRHTPDNPSGEFKIIAKDGDAAGWVSRVARGGEIKYATYQEGRDGGVQLLGWADSLSHAADVATNGEAAASSGGSLDARRIGGRLFERNPNRGKTIEELDREAERREQRMKEEALGRGALGPEMRRQTEKVASKPQPVKFTDFNQAGDPDPNTREGLALSLRSVPGGQLAATAADLEAGEISYAQAADKVSQHARSLAGRTMSENNRTELAALGARLRNAERNEFTPAPAVRDVPGTIATYERMSRSSLLAIARMKGINPRGVSNGDLARAITAHDAGERVAGKPEGGDAGLDAPASLAAPDADLDGMSDMQRRMIDSIGDDPGRRAEVIARFREMNAAQAVEREREAAEVRQVADLPMPQAGDSPAEQGAKLRAIGGKVIGFGRIGNENSWTEADGTVRYTGAIFPKRGSSGERVLNYDSKQGWSTGNSTPISAELVPFYVAEYNRLHAKGGGFNPNPLDVLGMAQDRRRKAGDVGPQAPEARTGTPRDVGGIVKLLPFEIDRPKDGYDAHGDTLRPGDIATIGSDRHNRTDEQVEVLDVGIGKQGGSALATVRYANGDREQILMGNLVRSKPVGVRYLESLRIELAGNERASMTLRGKPSTLDVLREATGKGMSHYAVAVLRREARRHKGQPLADRLMQAAGDIEKLIFSTKDPEVLRRATGAGPKASLDTSGVRGQSGGMNATTQATPGTPQLGVTTSSKGRTTTVTLPDGTTAQRTSKTMTYTHAVVGTTDLHARATGLRSKVEERKRFVAALEQWIADGSDTSKLKPHRTGNLSFADRERGKSNVEYYLPGFEPVMQKGYGRGASASLQDPNGYSLPNFKDPEVYAYEFTTENNGKTRWEVYGPAYVLESQRESIARWTDEATKLEAGPRFEYKVARWSQRADTAFASIGSPEVSENNTTYQVIGVGGVARADAKPAKVVPTAEEKAAAKAAADQADAERRKESDRRWTELQFDYIRKSGKLTGVSEKGVLHLAREAGVPIPRLKADRDGLREAIVAKVRGEAPTGVVTPADAIGALNDVKTRDEATAILSGMTVEQLKEIAAKIQKGGITLTGTTKARIVRDIVEFAVGRRLDSLAIENSVRAQDVARLNRAT